MVHLINPLADVTITSLLQVCLRYVMMSLISNCQVGTSRKIHVQTTKLALDIRKNQGKSQYHLSLPKVGLVPYEVS